MSAQLVRRATIDDVAAVAPLFDAYRQFYGYDSDLPLARTFLEDRLTELDSVVLLSTAEDEATGFAQLYPTWSSLRCRAAWILNDLFVAPAARGQGTASALLVAAESIARDSGAAYITLDTQANNVTAQRLYERHGYIMEQEFVTWNLAM